jgi:hypothetical protein
MLPGIDAIAPVLPEGPCAEANCVDASRAMAAEQAILDFMGSFSSRSWRSLPQFIRAEAHCANSARRGGFAFSVEPPAAGRDISKGANPGDAVMTQWNDTMVDRPESDGAIYATGWSISALAVLGVILAVWIFGI